MLMRNLAAVNHSAEPERTGDCGRLGSISSGVFPHGLDWVQAPAAADNRFG